MPWQRSSVGEGVAKGHVVEHRTEDLGSNPIGSCAFSSSQSVVLLHLRNSLGILLIGKLRVFKL